MLVPLVFSGIKLSRKVVLIIVLYFLAVTLIPDEQMARFEAAGNDETSELRLTHWQNAIETIRDNPWGIGYANWGSFYAANSNVAKVEQIHNTPLEAFVELGIIGGTAFHLALLMAFVMNRRTRREMAGLGGKDGEAMAAVARGMNLGMLGTFVAALFMSVLWYPMYWLAFALTSALRHISRDLLNKAQTDTNK